MEIWKPIVGFEGLYEISTLANVRRVSRGKKIDPLLIPIAKQMFTNGSLLRDVAKFLGVSVATAHMIKTGRTWSGDAHYRHVKTSAGSDHYLRFAACKNGNYVRVSVHRAMWEAFVKPIEGRLEINHKNLDRQDNRLENFEIVTHQQNIQHAINMYKEKGLLRAVKGTKGFIVGKHSKYDR